MSNILVPQNSGQIYPLNKHSYLESVVRNLKNVSVFYGFIGPHGKRLNAWGDASGKDYYSRKGSLNGQFAAIFGHRYKRWQDHFDNALANGYLSYRENHRHVVYAPVVSPVGGGANVITTGDLRSATSFPWTSNLATTQQNFSKVFLGVALDPFPNTNPASDPYNAIQVNTVRVDVSPSSLWDFTDQNSEDHYPGSIMAPAKATGNSLLAQTLVTVAPLGAQSWAGYADGIARVMRVDPGTPTTSVLVNVQSAFWGYEATSLEGS